jgi:hypothetical protein
MTDLAMRSANSWFGIRLLPSVLSLTAGSMDVIGFLGFGGLKRRSAAVKECHQLTDQM